MTATVPKKVAINLTLMQSLGIIQTMAELFGTGAGVILYHMGRGIGRAMSSENKDVAPSDAQERVKSFAASLSKYGWCEAGLSKLDEEQGSTTFTVKKLALPNEAQDDYEMIIRGICSGYLEELWGGQVSVLRGSARGDSFELLATKGGAMK